MENKAYPNNIFVKLFISKHQHVRMLALEGVNKILLRVMHAIPLKQTINFISIPVAINHASDFSFILFVLISTVGRQRWNRIPFQAQSSATCPYTTKHITYQNTKTRTIGKLLIYIIFIMYVENSITLGLHCSWCHFEDI